MSNHHAFNKILLSVCTAMLLLGTLNAITRAFSPELESFATSAPALSHDAEEVPDMAETTTGIHIVSSDARGIVLELVTPAFDVSRDTDDTGVCSLVQVDGYGSSAISGYPELPVMGTVIGIPDQAESPSPCWMLMKSRCLATLTSVLHRTQLWTSRSLEKVAFLVMNAFAMQVPTRPLHFHLRRWPNCTRWVSFAAKEWPRYDSTHSSTILLPGNCGTFVAFACVLTLNSRRKMASCHKTFRTSRVDEGIFEDVLAHTLINYEDARAWRVERQPAPLVAVDQVAQQDGPSYKITIDEDGIYQITYDDLQAAEIPVDTLDPRTLKLENAGSEVAIHVVGQEDGSFDPGDYVLFYGLQTRTKYTDVNAYWLSWGGENGLRMAASDASPSGTAPVPGHFQVSHRVEEDHNYQSSLVLVAQTTIIGIGVGCGLLNLR